MKKTILFSIVILFLLLNAGCYLQLLPIPSNSLPQNGSQINGSTVLLQWEAINRGSVTYVVEMGQSPTSLQAVSPELSTNQYNATGLQSGKTYYWRVRAQDSLGSFRNGDIWSFSVTGGVETGVHRALLLGVTDYSQTGSSNLNYTDDDANDMHTVLSHLDGDYEVQKLIGTVTKPVVLQALANFAASSSAGDVLVFFYAGHGGYGSGESYMYLSDGQTLGVAELRLALDAIAGERIVLIDACQSGAFTDLTPTAGPAPLEARQHVQRFNQGVVETFSSGARTSSGYYVMTGASINRFSYEDAALQNGYMTFFTADGIGHVGLLNPLAAFDYTYNADSNGDDRITLNELYQYVYPLVDDYSDGWQDVQVGPSGSNHVIASW
ncbi:MAG TPA: caspase family protein [Thermotogota bacterium]|nr:caspase family protein [Thermotogota bacterium]HRW92062.1 caspase family protein [Thermotogota bacterium]